MHLTACLLRLPLQLVPTQGEKLTDVWCIGAVESFMTTTDVATHTRYWICTVNQVCPMLSVGCGSLSCLHPLPFFRSWQGCMSVFTFSTALAPVGSSKELLPTHLVQSKL